jgi:hypothetical protein
MSSNRRFDRTFPRVLVAIIATPPPPPALRLVRYVEKLQEWIKW